MPGNLQAAGNRIETAGQRGGGESAIAGVAAGEHERPDRH